MEPVKKKWQDLMIPSAIIVMLITIFTSLLYTLIQIALTTDLGKEWLDTLDFLSQLILYGWFIFSYLAAILLVIFRYWGQDYKFQLILSLSILISLLVPIILIESIDKILENFIIYIQIIVILVINLIGWVSANSR